MPRNRDDAPIADQNVVVGEHPLAIHRDHVDALEYDRGVRWRRWSRGWWDQAEEREHEGASVGDTALDGRSPVTVVGWSACACC